MTTKTKLDEVPFLTLDGLQYIRQEVNAARYELIEMLRIGGEPRAIWSKPRKYFEPEDETYFPVPNEELSRLLKPTWNMCDLEDPVRGSLLGDIFAHAQYFKFAREKLIPENFK